jgi:hypothetical protein
MILDSVGDGMYRGYEDGSAALYATADDSDMLITSSNGMLVMNSTNSMRNASCIVAQMTLAWQTQCSARDHALKVSCRSKSRLISLDSRDGSVHSSTV